MCSFIFWGICGLLSLILICFILSEMFYQINKYYKHKHIITVIGVGIMWSSLLVIPLNIINDNGIIFLFVLGLIISISNGISVNAYNTQIEKDKTKKYLEDQLKMVQIEKDKTKKYLEDQLKMVYANRKNKLSNPIVKEFKFIFNNLITTFNNSKFSKIENISISVNDFTIKFVDNIPDKDCCGYCIGNTIVLLKSKYNDYDTIAHELAHAIDNKIRGRSCHDQYWQTIMNTLTGQNDNYLKYHEIY